jgi:hypothetical protein
MTLEQAASFNDRLAEFLRAENAIKKMVGERWLPKYLRRTGLPVYWSWAHEFTLLELISMMAVLTDSSESFVTAIKSEDRYGALLAMFDEVDSDDEKPPRPRRVVVVLAMLYALAHSMRAIGFHSLSINELVNRGLAGDELALKQAVAVDATVLAMPSVASHVAQLQLGGERKRLAALYKAAAKGPNKQLEPNWQLRYMERVLDEEGVIGAHGKEAVFKLVTERLKLYDTRGADPFKGLFTTFQRWRDSATT